jgi:type II secretion system protein I
MNARGFTLIETLVALLIVAVAYAGVTTAVSQFVDQRLLLQERTAGHRIAWNRLMEQYLVSKGVDVQEQNFAGQSGTETWRGQRWSWQISEKDAAGEDLVRYQVDVFADKSQREEDLKGSLVAYFIQ